MVDKQEFLDVKDVIWLGNSIIDFYIIKNMNNKINKKEFERQLELIRIFVNTISIYVLMLKKRANSDILKNHNNYSCYTYINMNIYELILSYNEFYDKIEKHRQITIVE